MELKAKRNYDLEFQDTDKHKYSYGFDEILRKYMIQEFSKYDLGEKVLELGCFEGNFTNLLAQRYKSVHVIEASEILVNRASSIVPENVKFMVSTFEDIELEERYDAIFIIHTLEHLDDPVSVLKKCQNWLNVGGKIVIAVPNSMAPSRQLAVKMGIIESNSAVTDDEKSQGHRITYSLDTLIKDLKKANFKIFNSGGVLFKPLANFQIDKAIKLGVIDSQYIEACYQLGMHYPELCSSIYVIGEVNNGN